MKTEANGNVEYEPNDEATFYGVSAPRWAWSMVGIHLYKNSNSISSNTSSNTEHSLGYDLAIAIDSLPPGTDGPTILRRYAAMRRKSYEHASLCSALRAINISVPSNINVWQHLKGAGQLTDAAKSMSEAVKQLVESAAD